MYIRRKVFSILDTEIGERLFSTTDYILDQREFAGETKRRNKALKRQYLEKLGQERMERYNNDDDLVRLDKYFKSIRDRYAGLPKKGAGNVVFLGRSESNRNQGHDDLAFKERIKRDFSPEEFKDVREITKRDYMKNKRPASQSPKPTTPNPEVVVVPEKSLVVSNSKPTTVVPEKALVVSNSKPVVKTESKLSKLAKNKYAKGAAGLLVLGGTAAGGYYLLNKKKNKKDKEDKE